MLLRAFIQDPKTKEMLASAILPVSEAKPAYFNWNNWSECIFNPSLGEIPNLEEMCNVRKTCLSEMYFSVNDAVDLKKLSFEIAKSELKYYEILGVSVNEDLIKDYYFEFLFISNK